MAVASNLTDISLCEATTNFSWSGGPIWATKSLAGDDYPPVEGTYMLGCDLDVETGLLWYDVYAANSNVSQDYSGRHFHVWIWVITAGFLDIKSNGGLRMMLQDSSGNEGYWYVGGSDTYAGGWQKFIIDCDSTPTTNNGTDPTVTSINKVGIAGKATAKSKLGENFLTDLWQYNSSTSQVLTVTGGTSGTPLTWEDILTADEALSKPTGILRKSGGVYFLQGPLLVGDTGTGDTYFKDTNQTIIWEDTLASNSYYDITLTGNSTGTTSFVLGSVTGTGDDRFGYGGGVIKSAGTHAWSFDAETNTTNIDECFFYGVNCQGSGVLQFDDNTNTQLLISCTFDDCGMVQPNETLVLNSFFLNCTDALGAVEMLNNDDDNIKYCTFRNCTNGVHIPSGQTATRDLVGLDFDDVGSKYDFYNSATAITVNNDSNSNANSYNTAGNAVTFVSSATITVNVEDSGGNDVNDAQVYIQKATPDSYTSGAGNAAGDTDFVVNTTIAAGTSASGWISIIDMSENEIHAYRYASWTGSTFTLETSQTGTVETQSDSETALKDTGIGSLVVEGELIRNTTSGDWALVDEITDANNIVTTPLQGAGDNLWQTGDTWDTNKLQVAYVSTVDRVDVPILNKQTASGQITGTWTGSTPLPIKVRIRSNNEATKFEPYDTSGSIESTGYTLTAVLTEDTVAT